MVNQMAAVAGGAVCLIAPAVAAEPDGQEVEERLDRLASAYEDLAMALSGVEDLVDADLVAGRAAADFLLLRELHAALSMTGEGVLSPEFTKSFKTRCEEAARSVEASIARLRENHCFYSDALPAALSLSCLRNEPLQKTPAMAACAMELLMNNREMVILMLDEAVDEESAPQVAVLVQAALVYDDALAAFVREVGEELLDEEQKRDFGQRMENFTVDLAGHRERLEQSGFYGTMVLRSLFDHSF